MEPTMKIAEEGYRWAPCGTVDEATCHTCGAPCEIIRNKVGPTCYAQTVGNRKSQHDQIRCPHRGEDWHNRAVRLQRAIHDHPSERLKAIMREELEALIQDWLPGG